MTIAVKHWDPPKQTQQDLDWAELTVLDFSNFDQDKYKLAAQLKEAASKDGFFSIVNITITQQEVYRQFALGDHFFSDYSEQDKRSHVCDFANGDYFGFKPKGEKKVFDTKVLDNVETLNIPKFNGHNESYYKQTFLKEYRHELEAFSKKSHQIGNQLLQLFATILEIDENYFVDNHKYSDVSDDHLRFMKYHPRSIEDDNLVENIWGRGHTDFGTLTLLYNQRVAGLQIKLSNGDWKYVKPIENGIICNIGDTLSFWSGGYFKSTIHRVVRPPEDQVDKPRIGTFYFFRPGDNTEIKPIDSPLLRKLGLYKDVPPINGTEYVRSRVKSYHDTNMYGKQDKVKFKFGSYEIADGYS